MTFFLAFLLCAGVLAELLSLRAGLKRISFDYRPDKELAEQGEQIPVCMEVKNTGILPVSYLLVKAHVPFAARIPEDIPSEKEQFQQTANSVFRMWGKEGRRRTVPITIEKRGVHYFRGAHLESTDFAGLRKVWDFYDRQEQVFIYPRAMESKDLISTMGQYYGDMIAQRHLLRDPILTAGIREYTGAEPMKTISWSQSARRGQMMVRDFEFIRDLSCTVLLMADGIMPTHVQKLDRCCSIVRTVCREMTDKGVNVDFYTNCPMEGFGIQTSAVWKCVATQKDQWELLRGLALLAPSPVRCAADLMAVRAARAMGHSSAFVIVAPFENEAVLRAKRVLEEASGVRVVLILESEYSDSAQKGGNG